ncbi:DUF6538 domain-containing protein [Bradyrhizobium sp.]|uniref:DUF6538 domain-containing protein n=1 Tax=Bradyrhizobium sp. TaxID=376 RepID=UPI00351E7DBD
MVHHDGPREPEIPIPSYLRLRGHTWFLRWKWPKRLAACGLSGELIRSLRTSDFRVARRRALTLVLQIETMTEATQLPKRAELESAIRRWIDDSVWRRDQASGNRRPGFFGAPRNRKDGPRGRKGTRRPLSVCLEHVRAAAFGEFHPD